MSARVRKFVGGIGILVFLAAYIWAVTAIAEHVPDQVFIQTLFYAVAGISWGVPILPLLSWMNRGK
ncbi:DUF2842 domain-containing protein [Phenylobacterium sp.]|uniref:DUF2842 domain-containing protein n=1 Tax=Phenylobacterium sp. TaxID=1871053 RepID=UPI00286E0587|nr:DUF2842 domain-containing protein [Phenylobacterium sp.]